MATMQKEEYKDRLRSQFDTALLDREEMEPDWMSTVRQRAMDAFEGQGFPTTRMEDWRYFNLSPLWQNSYSFQPVLNFNELAVKRNDLFGMNSACRMVFVNGRFSRELSSKDIMPKNLTVLPLSEAYSSHKESISSFLHNEAVWGENSLRSLNTAFMQDGALISIPDGMIVEEPIWLVFMAIPAERLESYQPRILVIAGENSQMTLIESHVAYKNGEYWSNPMVQLHAKQGAVIDHYKIQMESPHATHTSHYHSLLERDVHFTATSLSFGGGMVRNDIQTELKGEGIECTLNGLYMADERRLVDHHTSIDHQMPRCVSHELYKGIINGHATAVFNGKVYVREDAQKTDAKQTNQNLLLSADATVNTKPQLEIFADDVRCTHGATVGQLNEDELFYLRSRGISKEEGKKLLIWAFASDIIGRIKVDSLRYPLQERVFQQFNAGYIK